jgi:hypothetical protein
MALPAAGASLQQGTPPLQLRVEVLGGQPTTLLGVRPGVGLGISYRLTDQLSAFADTHTRAAPGGGITSAAFGMSAMLDITPIEPYLELAVVGLTNRNALGYSLATRFGVGADWPFAPGLAAGMAVRTYTAFDAVNDNTAVAGFEVALRLVFTPGAR